MIQKIVFTGPESSGKTTLAEKSAKAFKLPLLLELARVHPDVINRTISESTILNLFEQTIEQEREKLKSNPQIICDTSYLVLYVWQKVKFNTENKSIKHQIIATKEQTHYLLCKPDIPWVCDVLREDPNDRLNLFEIYLNLCKQWNLNYSIVQGNFNERLDFTFQQLSVLTTKG